MMTEGRFVGFDGNLFDEKAMKTQSIYHISGLKRIIKQTKMKGLCLPFRALFLFQSKNKIWPMRINLLLVRLGRGGLWEIQVGIQWAEVGAGVVRIGGNRTRQPIRICCVQLSSGLRIDAVGRSHLSGRSVLANRRLDQTISCFHKVRERLASGRIGS